MLNRAAVCVVVMGALVHCGSDRESNTSRSASRLVLERFPSIESTETGVDEWDLGSVTTEGNAYVVGRGYTVASSRRSAILEIVARADGSGGLEVRGAQPSEKPALDRARAEAIARDYQAMAAAVGSKEGTTATKQSLRIASNDESDGGGGGSLVGPAVQLLGCAEASNQAGQGAGAVASQLVTTGGSAGAPASATLGEGGPEQDRECSQEDGYERATISALFNALRSPAGEARRADLERLLTSDVVWNVPGTNKLAGAHRGIDGVDTYLDRLAELTPEGPFTPSIDTPADGSDPIVIEGGSATVASIARAVRPGAPCTLQTPERTITINDELNGRFTLHVGFDATARKIRSLRTAPASQQLFDCFWSR